MCKRGHTWTLHRELTKLKIPLSNIKTLMKSLHYSAIKYLTYLILNKRKLNNKQTPVPPKWKRVNTIPPKSPPPNKGKNTLLHHMTPWSTLDLRAQIHTDIRYGRNFSFLFFWVIMHCNHKMCGFPQITNMFWRTIKTQIIVSLCTNPSAKLAIVGKFSEGKLPSAFFYMANALH